MSKEKRRYGGTNLSTSINVEKKLLKKNCSSCENEKKEKKLALRRAGSMKAKEQNN